MNFAGSQHLATMLHDDDADNGFLCSVTQLVREAQTMKEQRDAQIAELKTLAEQNGETVQHDFEKKVSVCFIRVRDF